MNKLKKCSSVFTINFEHVFSHWKCSNTLSKVNSFKNAPRSRLISIFFRFVVLKSNSSQMFSSLSRRHQFDCRLSTWPPLRIGSLRLISSKTIPILMKTRSRKYFRQYKSNREQVATPTILSSTAMFRCGVASTWPFQWTFSWAD